MRLSFGRRVYDGDTIAVAFPRIDRILWLSISISKTGFISVMSQVYRIANSRRFRTRFDCVQREHHCGGLLPLVDANTLLR